MGGTRAIYNKTAFRIELDIKELGYNKDKELSVALSELTTYKCDDILKEYFESVFNQEKYRKWEPWFLLEDIYNNNWIQKYNYLLKNKYKKSDFYFSESDKKLISKMFSSEIMKEKVFLLIFLIKMNWSKETINLKFTCVFRISYFCSELDL